jgi:hypothetical protein
MMYWGQRFQKLIDSWMDQKTQKDKKEVIARFIAMLNQRSGEVQKEESSDLQKKLAVRHKNIDKYTSETIAIGSQVKIIDSGIVGTLIEQKGSKFIVAIGGNLRASLEREKFVRADAPIGDKPKKRQRNKTFKNKAPQDSSPKEAAPKNASAESKGETKKPAENKAAATPDKPQGEAKKKKPARRRPKKAKTPSANDGPKTEGVKPKEQKD